MSGSVAIRGDGVAACCCAALLTRRGFRVYCEQRARATAPTLLINLSTQRLLADVFGPHLDLFRDCLAIRKRVVLWGTSDIAVLPHAGVAVNEAMLLARLWERVETHRPLNDQAADWYVCSTPRTAPGQRQAFGTRIATAVQVQLRDAGNDACWVESLEAGWLFLLPFGDGCGSLLAIGGAPDELLEQSRLIAPQIDAITGAPASFPAHQQILRPLCGAGWLSCGNAAMRFDPICGEGAGNAVREAILACAVISSPEAALSHYSSRLLSGFLRHLDVARQFYASCRGDWWRKELAELDGGIEWTRRELATLPPTQFRLNGFDLERLPELVGSQAGSGEHAGVELCRGAGAQHDEHY